MRHRTKGRKLGRNPSHRKAMFRNMACSFLHTMRIDEEAENAPKVAGRITTTVPKAKELRPFIERLVTLARNANRAAEEAGMDSLRSDAERGSDAWKKYRASEDWQKFKKAEAPYGAARRRAFSLLRDRDAVDILFDEVATRFSDRPGGYTRIVRLAERRLGDAGEQAIIEFVGENDRVRSESAAPAPVVVKDEPADGTVSGDENPEASFNEATAEDTVTAPDPAPTEEKLEAEADFNEADGETK